MNEDRFLMYGVNSDVVACVRKMYEEWKEQARDLVAEIQYGSVDDKCQAIFGYLIDHVSYKLDTAGYQYIKSPKRLLRDGCGDCKSLTMFVVCCLHCLGIKHIIRFVNFDGGSQYTHVYPVAIDEYGQEIILDACEKDTMGNPIYDYAREYCKKQDFVYER